MPNPAVLLLTHRRDHFCIDRVLEGLRARGARAVRFDTDRFPREHLLTVEDGAEGPVYRLETDEGPLFSREVEAVWTRGLWAPDPGEDLEPGHREACVALSRAALEGLYDALGRARWINDFQAVRSANKLRQWRLAAEVGLCLPRTLVTSDPEAVRPFFDALEGRMVTKLLTPLTHAMEWTPDTLGTSEVSEDDLHDLDSLRLAPMVFQERIPKALELRVMMVDGRLFAGAIRAAETQRGAVDWRRADPREVSWTPGEVPEEVADKLRQLMRRLGLVAGAVDLIVTPSGEHVFLEVNPLGEWGMLERDLDLPISQALVSALLPTLLEAPAEPSR